MYLNMIFLKGVTYGAARINDFIDIIISAEMIKVISQTARSQLIGTRNKMHEAKIDLKQLMKLFWPLTLT